MQPELEAVLVRLRDAGAIPRPQAAGLLRIARGRLISVHAELRVALYGGVLALVAGVGILLGQELHRLGPLAVTASLAMATALCFWWVARQAPPFTWGCRVDPHFAFDYILLLGTLLGAADLGYVEARFTPLGPAWPWHLLIVALVAGAVAVRYDSPVVFSAALSSFAAWRGVAITLAPGTVWKFRDAPEGLRLNALACGLLFIVLGRALLRFERKPHFEPVAVTGGALLCLGALASGVDTDSAAGLGWTALTLLGGTALLAWGWRGRRFVLLAIALLATYVALTALFFRCGPGDELAAGWFLVTAIALVVSLVLARQRLREDQ